MNPWYRSALIALTALLLLQVTWCGFLFPPSTMSKAAAISLTLALFTLPLIASRRNLQSGLLVGSLLAIGYFCHGVMEAWANPPARLWALLEVTLSIVVVVCAGRPAWQNRRYSPR